MRFLHIALRRCACGGEPALIWITLSPVAYHERQRSKQAAQYQASQERNEAFFSHRQTNPKRVS